MVLQEWLTIPDDDVVTGVRAGERGLYELLMRRYNQRLFRVVRSVVTNDGEAEDVLQEAWVRAYEHLDQFERRASFSTWVTRIAYHEALARTRNSKRWTPLENPDGGIMAEADRRQSTSETPETQSDTRAIGTDPASRSRHTAGLLSLRVRPPGGRAAEHQRDRRMSGAVGGGGQDAAPSLARPAAPGIGGSPGPGDRGGVCLPRSTLRPNGSARPRAHQPMIQYGVPVPIASRPDRTEVAKQTVDERPII